MAKLKSFFKLIGDVLDDVLAYILTVVGILLSNALPLMKSNEPFTLDIGAVRIVVALLVAFLFVTDQESLGVKDAEGKAIAKSGRRKNFRKRMANALSQGFMWAQIMNVVG
jgi:hypothetical protein